MQYLEQIVFLMFYLSGNVDVRADEGPEIKVKK
jgi:hypothetical protein